MPFTPTEFTNDIAPGVSAVELNKLGTQYGAVKAEVEVGDLKTPTKNLNMNGQDISNAGELHGAIYWGDVHFEDVECPACHRKFRKGDRIRLMVNLTKEKSISAFPVHLKCEED
ncbi:hypothetical protein ES708_05740 [subsurface metagenome]